MKKIFLTLMVSASIVSVSSCGGGAGKTDPNAPTTAPTFKPTSAAANATFTGTSATGAPVPDAAVYAYDSKGAQCATGKTNTAGQFSIVGKCIFPVLLAADTQDSQGRTLFAIVPTIDHDGQSVPVNITPLTTSLVYIMNGGMPTIKSTLSASTITNDKLVASHNKLRELLQPIFTNLSINTIPDFQSGPIVVGQDQDILMDQLKISFEKITSTGANLLRLTFPSENRSITIVQDNKEPSSLRIDTGLGMDPKDIDITRMARSKNVVAEISKLINDKSGTELLKAFDSCYIHNGSNDKNNPYAIFDATMPWGDSTPIATNFRLIKYNTRVNFDNTTEENLNDGKGELVYISFDYKTPRGALSRTHTWMVKGTQTMRDGCTTSGENWRIAGNQRNTYVRTSAYSIHKIDYNSAFAGRKDTYGSGIELYLDDPKIPVVYALLSGPGLPTDGVVFLKTDGAFLVADTTPLLIRKAAINFKPSTKCDATCYAQNPKLALSAIFDTVDDTRSVLIDDGKISTIQDSFFTNTYTIRLFKNFEDLYPAMTVEDLLPKRPQLASEMKANNYPSLGVNLDTLVTALQQLDPVAINWSLPNDSRNFPLESYHIGFQRKNCQVEAKIWPGCTKRSTQTNEHFFTDTYIEKGVTAISLTPDRPVPQNTKTFESRLRVMVIDNLNRPLEVSVGMNYAL